MVSNELREDNTGLKQSHEVLWRLEVRKHGGCGCREGTVGKEQNLLERIVLKNNQRRKESKINAIAPEAFQILSAQVCMGSRPKSCPATALMASWERSQPIFPAIKQTPVCQSRQLHYIIFPPRVHLCSSWNFCKIVFVLWTRDLVCCPDYILALNFLSYFFNI